MCSTQQKAADDSEVQNPGSSVWNSLHDPLLAPRFWVWHIDFLANLWSPRIHDTYIQKFSLKTDTDEDTLEKVNIDGSIMWRLILKKQNMRKLTESCVSEWGPVAGCNEHSSTTPVQQRAIYFITAWPVFTLSKITAFCGDILDMAQRAWKIRSCSLIRVTAVHFLWVLAVEWKCAFRSAVRNPFLQSCLLLAFIFGRSLWTSAFIVKC